MTDELDQEIAQTAARCDAELTHMAKRAVVTEPAGDLVERVAQFLGDCRRADEKWDDLPEFIQNIMRNRAKMLIRLFQPQMEAAEGLLRAAAPFGELVDAWLRIQHSPPMPDDKVVFDHGGRVAWVKPSACHDLTRAIEAARAAGMGRESHD